MRSNKHLRTFPIASGNQEKQKVLSIEIDVKFLLPEYIFYYHSGTRRHRALRHTSEQHVRCRVQQNGRQEKYCSQAPIT